MFTICHSCWRRVTLGKAPRRAITALPRHASTAAPNPDPEPPFIDLPSDDLHHAPPPPDPARDAQREAAERYLDDLDTSSAPTQRTHPLTAAGKFGTAPATLQLPRRAFTDPTEALLAAGTGAGAVTPRQLRDAALRAFGGPGLPESPATPSPAKLPKGAAGALQQKPVALSAARPRMGAVEAAAFLAAVVPGVYACSVAALVECRKRLGSAWLEGLLRKENGPKVLDAGGGGAGVIAWREVVRAEWERMHPDGEGGEPPLGKASVVVGSPELRQWMSALLDSTSFLPRVPEATALAGKTGKKWPTYDVIIAPHTLWEMAEDWERKAAIQNYWNLLNPDGGVLLVLEKGLPRGFEVVAAARKTLLDRCIASPGSEEFSSDTGTTAGTTLRSKDKGMIIAPCTNHSACPAYSASPPSSIEPDRGLGKKFICHFSQRFERTPSLQRLSLAGLDLKSQQSAAGRNHEDIRFSYIAVRKGVDLREPEAGRLVQGDAATDAAFEGYDAEDATAAETDAQPREGPHPHPSLLDQPRLILRPLKRRGHVLLDVCTPSGTVERWAYPRSKGKLGYRDARKAAWGDLWAAGGAGKRVVRGVKGDEKNVR